MVAAGCFLLVMQLILKDRFPVLSTLYYLSPPLLLNICFMPSLLVSLFKQRWTSAAVCSALILFVTGFHYRSLLIPADPGTSDAKDGQVIRVLLWTPDHYAYTTVVDAFAWMTRFEADLIGLVEGNVDHGTQIRMTQSHFPGHQLELLPHGMLLLHRGEVEEVETFLVDNGKGALNVVSLNQGGTGIRVALYDQVSSPLYSRKTSLEQVALILGGESERVPTLLLGDFNTPHGAASFAPLRRRMNSTTRLGQGLPYTWPDSFPLLALDQIWFSGQWQPMQVTIERTPLAWHRPVVADFRLSPKTFPGNP